MEIRVELPSAVAASGLMWFFSASAYRCADDRGRHVVRLRGGDNLRHVVSEIRAWAEAHGVSPVVIDGGGKLSTLLLGS